MGVWGCCHCQQMGYAKMDSLIKRHYAEANAVLSPCENTGYKISRRNCYVHADSVEDYKEGTGYFYSITGGAADSCHKCYYIESIDSVRMRLYCVEANTYPEGKYIELKNESVQKLLPYMPGYTRPSGSVIK